jgi:hypothetical protein
MKKLSPDPEESFSSLSNHLSADLCASEASFRTLLAVLVVMLLTFFPACFTYLCTKLTDFIDEWTVSRHQLCGKAANIRAFTVQPDAVRHHLYVLFLQTRIIAMVAGLHTPQAFVDTFLVSLMHP